MSAPDPISPALEEALARFAGLVRQAGGRHGLTEADIDEVMQDVRVRLWRSLRSGESIAAVPASYVYKTATSAALDLLRRRRARREDHVDEGGVPEEAFRADQAAPDERALGAELVEQIMDAVSELIATRRPVVRMYLSGYRTEEIAALMGWTEPKARNLVYRGLADLRARLAARGIGPEGLDDG